MSTKERIIQLAEDKGLSKASFIKRVGLPRGLLDGDKVDYSVSDKYLAKIYNAYPDVNLEWLITGNEQMYKTATTLPPDVVSIDRYTNLVRENERLRLRLEGKIK